MLSQREGFATSRVLWGPQQRLSEAAAQATVLCEAVLKGMNRCSLHFDVVSVVVGGCRLTVVKSKQRENRQVRGR